ncbi:L-histidine N(alpha)-methyltransferase [Methylorubrum salsuginis]|uniref:Dimethylhistidine N-methyltransferase n=1 Tax=Methylorubrum salsuginis TaxID=414703 RepID=A0A1I4F9Y8_9HYPH|nr:L-histidine N(alpha)-methyltransferase [Methylorubrum salsuginis]SFL13687.1 dimethylhistidine N-methyltransferase [Methylorubrum salsuginis]
MADASETFLRDALAGLTAPTKTLPGKYLWDDTGSDLFDRICAHPDYYPTKHEMALLPEVAADVAGIVGAGVGVVEFGAGASRKIRVLLDAMEAPEAYVALDISGDFLAAAIARLAPDYPHVTMTPFAADYSRPIRLPEGLAGKNVLGFFAGTSIGNFSPDEAAGFLARARDTLGVSRFLVGADPTRDPDRLKRAYGACDGLMPALHLNLLARMNRELGADFALDNFRHEARVVDAPFRVEAHLVALRPAIYRLGGREIRFEPGESIRTDTSHKYAPAAFRALAERGGWRPEKMWLDQQGAFSLHLLRG